MLGSLLCFLMANVQVGENAFESGVLVTQLRCKEHAYDYITGYDRTGQHA